MKAFLMHRDRDFDLERALPANEAVLAKNLELDTLFLVMAAKDPLVLEVAKKAILTSVFNDVAVIEYRQSALKDCLSNPEIVRELYGLAVELAERQKKIWSTFREYPSGLLDTSVQRMVAFVDVLKRLRAVADRHSAQFKSEAFSNLFAMLSRELDDDYFSVIDRHLNRLKFRTIVVSAGSARDSRAWTTSCAGRLRTRELAHPRLARDLRGTPRRVTVFISLPGTRPARKRWAN